MPQNVPGEVTLSILNSAGKTISKKIMPVILSAFDRSFLPVEISLPKKEGGYLLLAEFLADGKEKPVISRRYIKVGKIAEYKYFEIQPPELK